MSAMGGRPSAGHALAFAAFLYVPLGLFAPKGEVPLLGLCALLLLLLPDRLPRLGRALRTPLAALLAALLAWAALSALWAIAPLGALTLSLRLALLFLGTLLLLDAARCLAPEARRFVGISLVAGAVLGMALIAIELLPGMPIRAFFEGKEGPVEQYRGFWMNRGMTALALMAWPAAAVLWRSGRRWAAVLLLSAALGLVLLGPQQTAQVAVAAALLTGALGLWLRRRAALVLAAAVALGCLVAPLVPALLPAPLALQEERPDLPYSVIHRLHIWGFVAERIGERPLLGWGFDASRDMPGGKALVPRHPPKQPLEYLPLHPHNVALQLWLELGLAGAILLAALAAYAYRASGALAKEPMTFAAALATITTGLVIASASYGIWQTQWLAALSLAAAFMLSVKTDRGAAP